MKKIVALVLSLVMVMGLATTAFAAYDEDTTYYMKTPNGTMVAAKFVEGEADTATSGTVDHFEYDGVLFVISDKKTTVELWDGDKAGDSKLAYLKKVESVTYSDVATKVDASLYATCTTDMNLKGYLAVSATGAKTYYKADEAGSTYILVGDEIVEVKKQAEGTEYVFGGHALAQYKAAAKDAAKTVFEYKCVVCGAEFDMVKTGDKAAGVTYAPYVLNTATKTYYEGLGYDVDDVKTSTAPTFSYWIIADAPAASAPSTDKVESAQTFDAGIAMYVGMSVMAAAGSAVVLKKKD